MQGSLYLKILAIFFFINISLNGQVIHTVNSTNDLDDGFCNSAHCSLREAINAANNDGNTSIINFNIAGAGTQVIAPNGPLPDITESNLQIKGETQGGNKGNLIVDFRYQNFGKNSYLKILANQVNISGIIFLKFSYTDTLDHILQIGNTTFTSNNSEIKNCCFHSDNVPLDNNIYSSVLIRNAENFRFSNNLIGSDFGKTGIYQTDAAIISSNISTKDLVRIDSNIFVNNKTQLIVLNDNARIANNIFGALDTLKNNNLFNANIGIQIIDDVSQINIDDNFFQGFNFAGINATIYNRLDITNNNFYNHSGNAIASLNLIPKPRFLNIDGNIAISGNRFLDHANSSFDELSLTNNHIEKFMHFINISSINSLNYFKYELNTILCNSSKIVDLNTTPGAPAPPVITSINLNTISGTALPNHVVEVYQNPRTNCQTSVCQGGYFLGKTLANNLGIWTLNSSIPNRSTVSAYQHENKIPAPLVYSEFSNCFSCTGPVNVNINPTICNGQNFIFRGTTYNASNPSDRITVVGDGVSICDTIYNISLTILNATRKIEPINLCYKQNINIGSINLNENHLVDSLSFKTSNGCDSIIVYQATIRGVKILDTTVCGANSLQIGSEIFDANRPTGTVIFPNASFFNCDSVIIVSIKFGSTTGFFTTSLCPGDSVLVAGKYFSDRIPTGQIKLTSYLGCDSLLNVVINTLPNGQGNYNADICRGDTIRLHGQVFTSGRTTGTIQLANGSLSNGCDSIIIVNLNVLADTIGSLDTSICDNQTLTLYGQTFSKQRPSGNLRIDNASYRGCDSFLMVHVTFVSETVGNISRRICKKNNLVIQNTIFNINNPSGSVRILGGSVAGCDSLVNVSLEFFPDIALDINSHNLECNELNSGSLSINSISGGSGNFNYSVDNGPEKPYTSSTLVQSLGEGLHQVKITDVSGCDTLINFKIDRSADLFLKLQNDTTVSLGTSFEIQSQVNFQPKNIIWNPAFDLSCSNCLKPITNPKQSITYLLTLIDSLGCEISDDINIEVKIDENEIWVPNTFSPNKDLFNDRFYPEFRFPEKSRILNFRIFDRWGAEIYSKSNGTFNENGEDYGWDGSYKNSDLMPGVYTYIIQYETLGLGNKWVTGSITLLK